MTTDSVPYLSDRPNRKVLLAVELWDPVALARVYQGVRVQAAGLTGSPLISLSGRFVWLMEGTSWPNSITVNPSGPLFVPQTVPALARPADLENAPASARLQQIILQLSAAYPLDDGLTSLRGRLLADVKPGSAPVADARVQLAWYDKYDNVWVPAPPVAGAGAQPNNDPLTDANGGFVVFMRVNPISPAQPDVQNGMITVRLQFIQAGVNPANYVTPPNYPFVINDPAGPAAIPVPAGRVPEGRALERTLDFGLAQLTRL